MYPTPKDRFWMVLNGVLSLSRSDPKLKDLVASFIEEVNRSTLVRGVSDDRLEEAAQVTDWKIKDNMLLLTIESGRLVRATSGLLRVRKALAPLLGRELRIGVRDLSVVALRVFIPLTVKPDEETIKRVKSIPKVSSIELTEQGVLIGFELLTEGEVQKGIPERAIHLTERLFNF